MTDDENSFRAWMDKRRFRASDVARRFGVSEQTIAHWRSQGVPSRKQNHVADIIRKWDEADGVLPSHPTLPTQIFMLNPSAEQFDQWNLAAISRKTPMTVREWATKGLDHLAAEWLRSSQLRLAEEESPHKEQHKRHGT